jgi:tetratricopeptide (TPR) repeat protein
MMERFDEAIEAFKKVLNLDPENHDALYNLGFAYNKSGLYGESLEICKRLTELNPANTNVRLLMGDSYNKLGKHEEAKREFDIYKELVFKK